MKKRFDPQEDRERAWKTIIGLGERSMRKSYYPELQQRIAELKQAAEERLAHLRFLEDMDRINRAMQGTNDLDQMMRDVLDVVLSIFESDRAYLLYPCDPAADSWLVPMERARPPYAGAFASEGEGMPVTPKIAGVFQIVAQSPGPETFGPGLEHPLSEEAETRFGFKSMLAMAIQPRLGKAWMFGVSQCSYPRIWRPDEQRLFQEIGRRLTDVLTNLLTYRDLRESEAKYRVLVESTSDAILMLDSKRTILSSNQAFLRLFGYAEGEIEGRSTRILHESDEDFDRFGGLFYGVIHQAGFVRTEWDLATKGRPRYLRYCCLFH